MLQLAKSTALLARGSTINKIKLIADISTHVAASPDFISDFLVAIEDQDKWWATFVIHNKAVLDALLDLDLITEFANKFL